MSIGASALCTNPHVLPHVESFVQLFVASERRQKRRLNNLRAILGWIPYLGRPSAGASSILMRSKDL